MPLDSLTTMTLLLVVSLDSSTPDLAMNHSVVEHTNILKLRLKQKEAIVNKLHSCVFLCGVTMNGAIVDLVHNVAHTIGAITQAALEPPNESVCSIGGKETHDVSAHPMRLAIPAASACAPAASLCGPAASARAPAASACGPVASLCGPAASLCGPAASLCGPAASACAPAASARAPAASACAPAASLCGPAASVCGPARAKRTKRAKQFSQVQHNVPLLSASVCAPAASVCGPARAKRTKHAKQFPQVQHNVPLLSALGQEYGVYVLANRVDRRTYVGCTNNFARRLRQHCGFLAGGAKATRGCSEWYFHACVTGFASRHMALSFEWYTKRYKKYSAAELDVCVPPTSSLPAQPLARRTLQLARLLAKFGGCRFPNLAVHYLEPPPPPIHPSTVV